MTLVKTVYERCKAIEILRSLFFVKAQSCVAVW